MALALVGGSLLSAFLQVLFDRMATPEFLNLFRERKNDEGLLTKLKTHLEFVEAYLDDAENKRTSNQAIKSWLDKLHDAVDEAEDLLDKINTEALRLKVEIEYQSSANQVRANICTCTPFLINKPKKLKLNNKFLGEIMPKIEEMVKTLEACNGQIGVLGLMEKVQTMAKQPYREPATSLVDETSVFGRDADIEKIVQMLLSEDTARDSITVVPIVGLGGMGKTTLAQMVYKDVRVKDHFSTRAWVCVSEEYDATRITKELLREFEIKFSDSGDAFNSLQVKLQLGLTQKKFLLVLDDVWDSDYSRWDNLRILFKGGLRGSKIIVTTRDLNVARMMGKEESIHHLDFISGEDCWSLFEKHAFENREGNRIPELEDIGRKIVRKCGQLPLAVKTVAGLLRSKTTAEEWENVLKSEEWSRTDNQYGILPALRLSYIHLPSQLKRCFAYCAVFHKDYQFKKEEIIQLWQANDLLEYPGDNERMENRGEKCFHDLRMRSLFQQSTGNLFSMHDLVNDLARFVYGKYCLRLEDHGPIARISNFSYHQGDYDPYKKFELLREAKHLRTFLAIQVYKYDFIHHSLSSKFLHDMLPRFKSLRFLSLSRYRINKLPDSIAGLKQLRFLDLSFTKIKNLPEWICNLYNLQTFLLSCCSKLQELPIDLRKLINLCYLDISEIPLLKEMPIEIGRLRSIQVLTAFVVGKNSGSPIEELGKFPMLRGKLLLSGLENVSSGRDASMANMKCKKHLESLTLEWKVDMSDLQGARDVLDTLEPYSNIKHLEINGYCGTTFPDWLGSPSFCKLESLRLSSCKYCISLSALGQLLSLQSLEMVGMNKISALTKDFYGDTSAIKPFPSLKKFKIEKMEELEKWYIPAECEVFCSLAELYIIDCPKLIGELPKQLLSLRSLEISGCGKLVLTNAQQLSTSLCELKISSTENLKELCGEVNKLASLEKLKINLLGSLSPFPMSCLPASLKILECFNCENLELESGSWQGGTLVDLRLEHCDSLKVVSLASFPRLNHLHIADCKSIEKLSIPPPSQSSSLTSLQSLYIWNCDDLLSFPEGGLPAPNLTLIDLNGCKKLKSLPEPMESLLPSLRNLYINSCPEIECFPEGGLPLSLQSLHIWDCEKLMSRQREWGLQRLPSLRSLYVCGNFYGSDEVEEDLLPCTLESLYIHYNRNLKMLKNFGHLTSFKELTIGDCPLLKSLPEVGLPASLTTLRIRNCPLLKPRLIWDKGQDWPKVAHIPCVVVDGELVP